MQNLARFRTRAAAALLVALSPLLAACSTNPATGRSQFDVISRDQEIAMGQEVAPGMVTEFGGEISDSAVQSYLTEMGMRMAAVTDGENPDLPWEFTMLDSDVINAFALPGGQVFVSRGLVERMNNEAQLASVVGHEIGHVTARHVVDRYSRQLLLSGVVTGAAVAVGLGGETTAARFGEAALPALQVGGQLVVLKFDRGQELEADKLGMRYMTRVGYDPEGALEMMQVLADASGGARQPEFLSTHPYPETRIEQMRDLLQTQYEGVGGVKNPQQYQQRVLSRLAILPPPPDAMPEGAVALRTVDWCGVCAHQAAHATQR